VRHDGLSAGTCQPHGLPVKPGNDGEEMRMNAELIRYSMGALTAEGALVYEEKISGRRPAVLVAPNWMGVTEKAIERGKLVAGDRYVVLVADMYGRRVRPADFGEAAQLANPLRADAAESRRRIGAALQTLIAEGGKRDLIDGRCAAIGFCFGGGNVLELARDGADIAAAVSIHGDLKTAAPAGKGAVKAKLLVAHGAPDPGGAQSPPRRPRGRGGCDWRATQMLVFGGIYHAIPTRFLMCPAFRLG
jgi:dienelactone hydrolase